MAAKPKPPRPLRRMMDIEDVLARRFEHIVSPKAEQPEAALELVTELLKARSWKGWTQEQLAARMHTSQAAVARLESGATMPTVRTLQRYAEATGHKLEIRLVPLSVVEGRKKGRR
jgi:ribosome-binding protein aMBF1 (putative translation factor)